MRVKGRMLFGLISILLCLLLVLLKVSINARSEYQKGEKAFRNKDFSQAITHFDRAIHWYSPRTQAIEDSIQALWEIGTQAENEADYSLALRAYRALRSSLYSVRSFYTPHADWITKCDDSIANILADKEVADSSAKGIPSAQKKQDILKLLKTQTAPSVFWSLLLEVGFVGWIACSIGLIFRGFSGKNGFDSKQAFGWGIFLILFYALWIVGMVKA